MKKLMTLILLFTLIMISSLSSYEQKGVASWYGGKFHGRLTANGEIFNTNTMTAAHKDLPFGTMVRVKNLDNGLETEVRINDRGPFVGGRIIDLSHAAAAKIGMIKSGTANVLLVVEDLTSLEIKFSIQVGAFGNLENAKVMTNKLKNLGLQPQTTLTRAGITRVFLADIKAEETHGYVKKLASIGISDIQIKQN